MKVGDCRTITVDGVAWSYFLPFALKRDFRKRLADVQKQIADQPDAEASEQAMEDYMLALLEATVKRADTLLDADGKTAPLTQATFLQLPEDTLLLLTTKIMGGERDGDAGNASSASPAPDSPTSEGEA